MTAVRVDGPRGRLGGAADRSGPLRLPWLGRAALTLLPLLVLAGLRAVQALSCAHMLVDEELLVLARPVYQQGPLRTDLDGLLQLRYMSYAGGTALLSLATVLIERLTAWGMWSQFAAGTLFELVALGLVMRLTRRLPWLSRVLAVALWIAPAPFVLVWQLLPFGNHTEFLVIPLLALLAVEARSALGLALIAGAGPHLYRFAVLASPAVLPAILRRVGPTRWRLTAALLLAAAATVWTTTELSFGLPSGRVPLSLQGVDAALGRVLVPGLADGSPRRAWALFGAMSAVAALGLRRRDRAVDLERFAWLWAVGAVVAVALIDPRPPRYLIQADVAIGLWVVALTAHPSPALRALGLAAGLGLLVPGVRAAATAVRPDLIAQNLASDRLTWRFEHNVDTADHADLARYRFAVGRPGLDGGLGIPSRVVCRSCRTQSWRAPSATLTDPGVDGTPSILAEDLAAGLPQALLNCGVPASCAPEQLGRNLGWGMWARFGPEEPPLIEATELLEEPLRSEIRAGIREAVSAWAAR